MGHMLLDQWLPRAIWHHTSSEICSLSNLLNQTISSKNPYITTTIFHVRCRCDRTVNWTQPKNFDGTSLTQCMRTTLPV